MTQKKLIDKLYYRFYKEDENGNTLASSNNVDILTSPFTECSHSICSMTTPPEDGFKSLGNTHTISYEGVKIPTNNSNSTVTVKMFKEILHINQPDGTITAKSVYIDDSSNDFTSANKVDWTILGTTGRFSKVNFATITYDNEGELFGYKFGRKIDLYQITDEGVKEETGPQISPPQINAPQAPPITIPQAPPQVTIPQVPPQVTIPQAPPITIPQVPPQVTIPQVPPQVTIPQVTVPQVPQVTVPQAPQLNVPTFNIPTFNIPTFNVPTLTVPTFTIPKINIHRKSKK